MLKKFINKLIEIFFPSSCLNCHEIISKEALFCKNCWPKLQFITETKCEICSYPFEVEVRNLLPLCGNCLVKEPQFDKAITIFRYNHIIKKIIKDLKYNGQTHISQKFAAILRDKIRQENIDFDIIIAVPLHLNRLKSRKFNQSALIAKNLHKLFKDKKFYIDLLFRVKDTKSQTKLTKKQRIKNLKRAFVVNKKYRDLIEDKKILLVDDIMTSQATIENCAKELKRRKANKVYVATIAKTVF
jgi:ComF family protein